MQKKFVENRLQESQTVDRGFYSEELQECESQLNLIEPQLKKFAKEIQGLDQWTENALKGLGEYLEMLKATHKKMVDGETAEVYLDSHLMTVRNRDEVEGLTRDFKQALSRFNYLGEDLESFKTEGVGYLEPYVNRMGEYNQIREVDLQIENLGEGSDLSQTHELDTNKTYVFSFENNQKLRENMQLLLEFNRKYVEAMVEGKKLPTVILHVEGGMDLFDRDSFGFFLQAKNKQELEEIINIAKELRYTEEHKPDFMAADKLTESQAKLYDNSDLREWENKTGNALETVRYKLAAMSSVHLPQETTLLTREPVLCLDVGIGEGRISCILTMLGKKVVGVDISEAQLKKVYERLEDEVEKYIRSDETSVLVKLVEQGLIERTQVITDMALLKKNLAPLKGDMLELEKSVFTGLYDAWDSKTLDVANYFGRSAPFVFEHRGNSWNFFSYNNFEDVSFDWHTFCDGGTIDHQRKILRDSFEMLCEGGLITIEVPDRTVGTYAKSLAEYHRKHPEEPFGTIRDETSTQVGEANVEDSEGTPRFFPGKRELVGLLRSVGFVNVNVETYLITSRDSQGQEFLEVKELVVTAQKPDSKGGVPSRVTREDLESRLRDI